MMAYQPTYFSQKKLDFFYRKSFFCATIRVDAVFDKDRKLQNLIYMLVDIY